LVDRGPDLEDDVGRRPDGARVRQDFGACRAIRVVGEARLRARAGVDGHCEAELHEMTDGFRRRRDASLAGGNFLWNPDPHALPPLVLVRFAGRSIRDSFGGPAAAVAQITAKASRMVTPRTNRPRDVALD